MGIKDLKDKLGRALREAGLNYFRKKELEEFRNYLHSPWRIIWANFLAGTMRGLGFLLGAAIVLAVLGFILKSVLVNIPIVGDFFEAVNEWIRNTLAQEGQANLFR